MPRNKRGLLKSRTKGEHLERCKVKTAIIKFILGTNEAVPEPDIREFLRSTYSIIDQGNIKKHLKDLQTAPYSCIEKIPPKQRGFANKWDVKKAENLKNIMHNFPEIRLNMYKKSLDIILKERNFKSSSPNANKFFVQLYLSASLFNMYIENNNETLYAIGYELYQDKHFDEHQTIKKQINEVYTEFIKRVSKDPNIWLVVCNEFIEDSLKSEVYENSLKHLQKVEISAETFQKIVEDIPLERMPFVWEEVEWGAEVWLRIILEMSIRISYEIFQKMLKEMPVQFTKASEEVLKRMSEEILNRVVEGNVEEICLEILKIKYNLYKMRFISIPDVTFEHCYHRDIADGIASPEEKEFMRIVRSNQAQFNEEDPISALKAYNDFYIKYYKKCREKIEI